MTSVTSCGGAARDRLTLVPIQSERLASEKPRATFCERSIIQQLIVIQAYLLVMRVKKKKRREMLTTALTTVLPPFQRHPPM